MLKEPTPEYCQKLLQYIPQRPDEDTWSKVVAAVGNTFPEHVALDLLLSRFTDEQPNEHARKLQNKRVQDFGYLVNLAKEHGYTPKGSTNGANYTPPTPRPTPEPDPVSFANADTDSLLFNEAGERIYRLAVNRKVVNKDKNHTALNKYFTNEELTLSQIADEIRKDYAICAAQLKANNEGEFHRLSANFERSEMIILDLDYSTKDKKIDLETYIPIDLFLEQPFAQPFAMIHTSFSSTPEHNRYRGLIPLPYMETNPERYQKVLKTFIDEYHADSSRSDVCGAFYGNTNATIYNLITGEIYHA